MPNMKISVSKEKEINLMHSSEKSVKSNLFHFQREISMNDSYYYNDQAG